MKPKYQQPHNIKIPSWLELNPALEDKNREYLHSRQKYEARREAKNRMEYYNQNEQKRKS
jgi:hypothetical protein